MRTNNTRIADPVFREGPAEIPPFFYPTTGCAGFPQGFSVLKTAAWKADPAICEVSEATAVIEVGALSEAEKQAFLCPGRGGFVTPPPEDGPPMIPNLPPPVCLDSDTRVQPLTEGILQCTPYADLSTENPCGNPAQPVVG